MNERCKSKDLEKQAELFIEFTKLWLTKTEGKITTSKSLETEKPTG